MMEDPAGWSEIPEYARNLLPPLAAGATGYAARRFMRHKPEDLSPCTTRVIRGNRGMPWDKQIAIHPRPDGSLEVTPL